MSTLEARRRARERKRRQRQLEALGRIVVPVEIEHIRTVEQLISAGFLDLKHEASKVEIGRALSRLIATADKTDLRELVSLVTE